ncbi:MAG: zf-HC2 domain-containing protein [Blastocatellia bacterium]|nr:zf-HC2 domain-containing protein [Blastocatellia bacterium]
MNKEKNEFDSLSDCGRKEDLVTYLYDEADMTDRASFERHLDDCDGCRDGLAAFGRVRRDLGAWQLEQIARPEITLRRSRLDLLRELIGMFPVWGRGAALVGAAAAMLLISLSVAGARIRLKDGDFAVSFGRTVDSTSAAPAVSSEEINLMVQNAAAAERGKMEELYNARLASFKNQLDADHQSKLRAARAEQQAQLRTTQAALQQEIRRFNRQNAAGIRAFFTRDDSSDLWGDGR